MKRYGDSLEMIGYDNLDAMVQAIQNGQHGPPARAAQVGVTWQSGFILDYASSHRWLHRQIAEGANSDRIPTMQRTLIHDLDLLQFADEALAQLESRWSVQAQAPVHGLADHWQVCIDVELGVPTRTSPSRPCGPPRRSSRRVGWG
jgi:hypothetical protein